MKCGKGVVGTDRGDGGGARQCIYIDETRVILACLPMTVDPFAVVRTGSGNYFLNPPWLQPRKAGQGRTDRWIFFGLSRNAPALVCTRPSGNLHPWR